MTSSMDHLIATVRKRMDVFNAATTEQCLELISACALYEELRKMVPPKSHHILYALVILTFQV